MRLHLFSDIHCDVSDDWSPPIRSDVDAIVVAGDVCEGIGRGAEWLRRHLGGERPIFLVPGNHEYFGRVLTGERQSGPQEAAAHNVTVLDDGVAVVGGVRFVGATLWADYELYGRERRSEMIEIARARMMDHRRILEAPGQFVTPETELALHVASRHFLETVLAEPFDGQTVVVTHHAPHPRSLAERYRENHISAAFISDLSAVIETYRPALWVHGHTHVSFDYGVGVTRVVCNPHGYAGENPAFDPELVVDV